MGLDIRDLGGELSYRRLDAILRHSPPSSAFAHSLYGDVADWSRTDHLLAAIFDQLRWFGYSGKGPKPKPTPRPGLKDESVKTRRFTGAVMTLEEAKQRYSRKD